jgi:hypothetical protein
VAIRRCCVIKASSSSQELERGAPPCGSRERVAPKCLKRFEIHHSLSLILRKTPQGRRSVKLSATVKEAVADAEIEGPQEETAQTRSGAPRDLNKPKWPS